MIPRPHKVIIKKEFRKIKQHGLSLGLTLGWRLRSFWSSQTEAGKPDLVKNDTITTQSSAFFQVGFVHNSLTVHL